MERISSQTSLQAADIVSLAKSNGDIEVTVSRAGNVRVLSGLPLVAAKLLNRIDPVAREKRIKKAERVVSEKLDKEFAALGVSESVKQDLNSTTLIDTLTSTEYASGSSLSKHPELQTTLQDIKNISDGIQEKNIQSVWEIIKQQTSKGSKADVTKAIEVVKTAKHWGEELKLDKTSALKLSSNAYKLAESRDISPDNAKNILLCSGKLISEHRLKPDDALDYAIEINNFYKGKAHSLDDLRERSNHLITQIPELKNTSDQMKLSAGICYLQLKKQDFSDDKINQIIVLRLNNRKLIQSKLPYGMKLENIHQGAHLRLKRSLGKQELKQLTNSVNDPSRRITTRSNETLEAAPKFSKMDPQFGYDAHRSEYELKNNNIPVQDFTLLEHEKRQPKFGSPFKILKQWLDELISFAGGDKAASACSAFISQTLFADLTRSMGLSRSFAGMLHSAAGQKGTTFFIYRLLKSDRPGSQGILVHNTLMQNAITLKFDRDFLADNEPPRHRSTTQPFDIPLIENAGPGAKARQEAFTVKYDFRGRISNSALESGRQYCETEEATIEYDLILDEFGLDAVTELSG